jgi:hypothetical protein
MAREAAEEALEDFKGFTRDNIEAKINTMAKALNSVDQSGVRIREQIKKLSEATGEDFAELIDSLNVAKRMKMPRIEGSRNVNMWAALSYAATGSAAGGVLGGPVGIAFGAATGYMLDRYGPRLAQRTLDQIIKIKGMPTVEKIRKMQLPDNIKTDLIDQLESYLIIPGGVRMLNEDEPPPPDEVNIGAGLVPRMRQEVSQRTDINALDRANMLSNLNESAKLINVRRFFFGEEETPVMIRSMS